MQSTLSALIAVITILSCSLVQGQFLAPTRAVFFLGDSTVNSGDNNFFYHLLGKNVTSYFGNLSDGRLIPDLIAEKIGIAKIPVFYSLDGTVDGLQNGVNFGYSPAMIMKSDALGFLGLNDQMRKAFETIQILQLQLGIKRARDLISNSIFYLSFGKDDYLHLFLSNSSKVQEKFGRKGFARILVNQITRAVKDLYNANVRKVVCVGIEPLGCTPRMVGLSYTSRDEANGKCIDKINDLAIDYNSMLSSNLVALRKELSDAQIVFCDAFQGMIKVLNNPQSYGFKNVNEACCGLGKFGATIGCFSRDMACSSPSTYIWWDLYNPTEAINILLAESIWSGQICHPTGVRQLVSESAHSPKTHQVHGFTSLPPQHGHT